MANKKRIAASASACALAGLMMFGGAQILAYMTDSETSTNVFTVGKVTVDLEEPNYPGNDSDEVRELVSNEPVDKDPQAENTGENTSVIFMSYDSPMADVIIVGNDGRLFTDGNGNYYINATYNSATDSWVATAGVAEKLGSTTSAAEIVSSSITVTEVLPADREVAHQEIFGVSHLDDGTSVSGARDEDGESWVLVKTVYVDSLGNEIADVDDATDDEAASAAAVRRVYAYTSLLEKDEITETLFDQVYLKNVVEGSIDSSIQEMTVKVYAIQAAYLKDASGNNILDFDEDDAGSAASITIDADTAADIFDIYVGQNGENITGNSADNNNAKDLEGDTRTDEEMYLKVDLTVDDTKLNVSETATATAAVDTNLDSVEYTFSSSDDSIATVDENTGVITAVKPGIVTITVTAHQADSALADATASVTVTVENELSVEITGSSDVMKDSETKTLTATPTTQPDGATVTYEWKSSNESVATVDSSGVVTAHDSGSAVITVTATMETQDGTGSMTATDSFDIYVQN
ncbi:MAG: Ig-like domain-containing protein [Clostridiales bacterium]|nr:Ig-like domain-containing protein [Clostridiales bacterium]